MVSCRQREDDGHYGSLTCGYRAASGRSLRCYWVTAGRAGTAGVQAWLAEPAPHQQTALLAKMMPAPMLGRPAGRTLRCGICFRAGAYSFPRFLEARMIWVTV